jgi:hypothetical protein
LCEGDVGPSSPGRPRSGRLQEQTKHLTSSDCCDCLCGASLISMVKSTDLWNLDDWLRFVRMNCPTFWCVLFQG